MNCNYFCTNLRASHLFPLCHPCRQRLAIAKIWVASLFPVWLLSSSVTLATNFCIKFPLVDTPRVISFPFLDLKEYYTGFVFKRKIKVKQKFFINYAKRKILKHWYYLVLAGVNELTFEIVWTSSFLKWDTRKMSQSLPRLLIYVGFRSFFEAEK